MKTNTHITATGKSKLLAISLLALGLILPQLQTKANATTLISEDFSSYTTPKTYTSNTNISSSFHLVIGSSSGESSTVSTSGIAFTDNSTSTNYNAALFDFGSTVSTTATGNNQLSGSFVINKSLCSSSEPDFAFGINGGTSVSNPWLNSSVTTAGFVLFGNGSIRYYTSSGALSSSVYTLTAGISYKFEINADYSSTTQDTYSFSIIDLSSGTTVYTSPTLNTWLANGVATNLIFTAGNNASAVDANPYVTISDIQFSAVPEPAATAGLILGSILFALRSTRRKNT